MPVGAYGGKREIMEKVAPSGRSTRPARFRQSGGWPRAWQCWN
jgi:glutamate-1-semialdehyde aminotransferase